MGARVRTPRLSSRSGDRAKVEVASYITKADNVARASKSLDTVERSAIGISLGTSRCI
jgi:hypothetical protein